MKKPPSRLKRVLREVQLVASAGAAVSILYALITSPLILGVAAALPAPESPTAGALLSALISHGTLLLITPAVCFAMRWVVDVNPARLGLGAALFAKAFLLALRFDAGGFEDEALGLEFWAELFLALLAGLLGALAARSAGRRVAARIAAEQLASVPASADLAEQLREAQAKATPAGDPAPASAENPKG